MKERPWNAEIGIIYSVLPQDQMIGYLHGKVIEQLAKWQNTGRMSDLEDAQQYMYQLVSEQSAKISGEESHARSTKIADEFYALVYGNKEKSQ